MLMWLLLCWCLVSVPVGVLVGRCIAAADGTPPASAEHRTSSVFAMRRQPDAQGSPAPRPHLDRVAAAHS